MKEKRISLSKIDGVSKKEVKKIRRKILLPLKKYISKLLGIDLTIKEMFSSQALPSLGDISVTQEKIKQLWQSRTPVLSRRQWLSFLTQLLLYLQEKQDVLSQMKEVIQSTEEKTISQTSLREAAIQEQQESSRVAVERIKEMEAIGSTLIKETKTGIRTFKWRRGDKNVVWDDIRSKLFLLLQQYFEQLMIVEKVLDNLPVMNRLHKAVPVLQQIVKKLDKGEFQVIMTTNQELQIELFLKLLLVNIREKQRILKTVRRNLKALTTPTEETIPIRRAA